MFKYALFLSVFVICLIPLTRVVMVSAHMCKIDPYYDFPPRIIVVRGDVHTRMSRFCPLRLNDILIFGMLE